MATTETSNPTEETPGWLNKYNQKTNKQVEWMKDFKTFCDMDHAALEKYFYDKIVIPVPPKDKPFTSEFPKAGSIPLLGKIMESTNCLSFVETVARSRNLFIALLAALAVWLFGGHLLAWIFLGIGVVLNQFWITLQLNARKSKFMSNYIYMEGLPNRYPDPAISSETFWNTKRWEKWVLARYDVSSEKELHDGLENQIMQIARSSSNTGLVLADANLKEWPLKPSQELTA
jgi:hypothetical protein